MKEIIKFRDSLNRNRNLKLVTGALSLAIIFSATLFASDSIFSNRYENLGSVASGVKASPQGEVLGASTVQLPDPAKDFSTAYSRKACTTTVPSGANLQTYLDSVQPGDVLCLTAGATYTGAFTLKKKTGSSASNWIVITTTSEAQLPEGKRVSPSDAGKMAKLIQPNAGYFGRPTLQVELSASYYRVIGLEITTTPGSGNVLMAEMGSQSTATNASELPHHIIFDRLYVHGNPGEKVVEGVVIDSTYAALINSYITEVHTKAADNQDSGYGVLISNTPGPLKIENNYIAASGINFFISGTGSSWGVPENVWFRGNYVKKDPAWKNTFDSKNLFELKSGRYILLEGNIFENYWGGVTNQGFAMVLKNSNQYGRPGQEYTQTAHVTVRYNKLIDISGGVAMGRHTAYYTQLVDGCCYQFNDNLFINFGITPKYTGTTNGGPSGTGQLFVPVYGNNHEATRDIKIEHNTMTQPASNNTIYFQVSKSSGLLSVVKDFTFVNNIVAGKLEVQNTAMPAGIPLGFPDADFPQNFRKNVIVSNQNLGTYAAANYMVSSYNNLLASDYSLRDPNSYIGTDGKPAGADIPKLNACISGVTTGTWTGCNSGGSGGGGGISVSISANPYSMTLPTNQTALTWTTTGSPTSCTASNAWSGQKAVGGSTEQRTGMTAGTYTFVITCSKSGALDASDSVTVTVSPQGGGGDTVPPAVSITSPSNSASVSGNVSIIATASDNIGVSNVEFYIDGVSKSSDSSSPYNYTWNTSSATLGSHTITAKAYDAAGNTKSSTISVTLTSGGNGGGGCVNPSNNSSYATPCPFLSLSSYNLSSGGPLTISVLPQGDYFYIFKTFYITEATNACPDGGSKISGIWCPLTFMGEAVPDDANYLTTANYTLSTSQISQLSSGKHYVASWDWAWDGSCFKGPGNLGCDIGKWRLQEFTK